VTDERITRISWPRYTKRAEEETPRAPISRSQQKSAADAAFLLTQAFSWADTAEGGHFWESVWHRLRAISNGEPLR
jgi:hypothetical protein